MGCWGWWSKGVLTSGCLQVGLGRDLQKGLMCDEAVAKGEEERVVEGEAPLFTIGGSAPKRVLHTSTVRQDPWLMAVKLGCTKQFTLFTSHNSRKGAVWVIYSLVSRREFPHMCVKRCHLACLDLFTQFLSFYVKFPGRNYIRPPPPLPPFLAKRHFPVEGGGGVYFEAPRGRNFIRPPPFYTPPTPLGGYFQGWGGWGCTKFGPVKLGIAI